MWSVSERYRMCLVTSEQEILEANVPQTFHRNIVFSRSHMCLATCYEILRFWCVQNHSAGVSIHLNYFLLPPLYLEHKTVDAISKAKPTSRYILQGRGTWLVASALNFSLEGSSASNMQMTSSSSWKTTLTRPVTWKLSFTALNKYQAWGSIIVRVSSLP